MVMFISSNEPPVCRPKAAMANAAASGSLSRSSDRFRDLPRRFRDRLDLKPFERDIDERLDANLSLVPIHDR